MTDTEHIDTLMKLTVPVLRDGERRSVIRLADVPADLLEAFRVFRQDADDLYVQGQHCVPSADWDKFLNLERMRCYRLMRTQSLALGADGPGEADLAIAPTLTDWVAVRDRQFGGAFLFGSPTGHPFCRGPLSHTSRLCGIDPQGRWARTSSRWYRLERMARLDDLKAAYAGALRRWAGCELTIDDVMAIIEEDRSEAR
jgi:hypothetical protein